MRKIVLVRIRRKFLYKEENTLTKMNKKKGRERKIYDDVHTKHGTYGTIYLALIYLWSIWNHYKYIKNVERTFTHIERLMYVYIYIAGLNLPN